MHVSLVCYPLVWRIILPHVSKPRVENTRQWQLILQIKAQERARQGMDPVARVAWEDAALARAWSQLVKRDIPRAAKLAAARRGGVMQEAEKLAEACSRELRLRAAKAAREAA